MFGILQKMDRFSNCEMGDQEVIDFIQEIVDNGMVWEMHEKYRDQALFLMGQGKVVDMTLRRVERDDTGHVLTGPCFEECCIKTAPKDAGGYNPFDTSLCG